MPDLAETEAAKMLLARLISEGTAVPLNLMGATGAMGTEVPDFVASAAVFSYIFTLRGNKAWKQMPATAGPVKVSPLALATYEMLVAKVTLSAYDLTTQLGKEVTEGAVLRALTELWSQLRVIPVPQLDGSSTLWELASARFTKQIKSGANAGQPTALSALISLYLGQAMVASEDEIESFLSPLAPRSRVRDVIHALLSARQLETLVIDGKTLLHVAGELPAFAGAPAATRAQRAADGADSAEAGSVGAGEEMAGADKGPESRISKFAAKPGSKIGTGLRSKPAFGNKPAFGKRAGASARPAFGGSRPAAGDRTRRPFERDAKPSFAKPTFNKPWEEDKAARAESRGDRSDGAARPTEGAEAPRRTFGARAGGGARPAFGARPYAPRPERSSSRSGPASGGDARPPRREFTPREGGASRGDDSGRAPRKTFSKPGTFGRKREGFAGKRDFSGGANQDGPARPARRDFNAGAAGEGRPPRRDFSAGERGERPAGGGFKRPGTYTPRPAGGERAGFGGKPSFGAGPGARPGAKAPSARTEGEAPRKIYRKFDAPRGPKASGPRSSEGRPASARPTGERSFGADRVRPARPASSDFARRPERAERPSARPASGDRQGGFAAKKPFSKGAEFSKAGGPFAKFADGKKPFRKPGAPKSAGPRSTGAKSAGPRKSSGGFGPTKRRPSGDNG